MKEMSKDIQSNYQILYFTTPFCGVCKSAKSVVSMLAMSLDLPFREQNIHTFVNDYPGLSISMTPAVALVYENKIVYYTETINNLTDLFQRFDRACSVFATHMRNG